jgi:hypothetical protein
MGTHPGWGLEHRASNPVSIKNLTAIETSTIVKLLRPYVPVGTKRTRRRRSVYVYHISYHTHSHIFMHPVMAAIRIVISLKADTL